MRTRATLNLPDKIIRMVNEMEFKKLTDQYSFHTEKALSYLLKTGVENV